MIWINVLLALLSVPVIILGGIKASEGKLWGEPIGYLAVIVLGINLSFIFNAIDVYRGKTASQINYRDGVAMDSVVVEKIYAASNPMSHADTFIFSYMEDFECYVYVKVNIDNKIEEIGINLEKRMHNTRFEDMNKTEASESQISIFNTISEEYWWSLYRQYQKNNYETF